MHPWQAQETLRDLKTLKKNLTNTKLLKGSVGVISNVLLLSSHHQLRNTNNFFFHGLGFSSSTEVVVFSLSLSLYIYIYTISHELFPLDYTWNLLFFSSNSQLNSLLVYFHGGALKVFFLFIFLIYCRLVLFVLRNILKLENAIDQICQNFCHAFFRIHAIVQFMQYDSMQCSLALI